MAIDKSVTPYFLFAALLWPVLCLRQEQAQLDAKEKRSSLLSIANAVIAEQLDFTAVPKRISYASREIWELQWKLEHRNRRNVRSTFNHPRFRAAYDFLLLREAA
ncbi:MAG: polynucleotide adenylyltransferase PcnB, partial [Pseudomonadales bacterium]|nr:polynucleotide adenylyltransferase PcnB [Pseudomonadales bacterium]